MKRAGIMMVAAIFIGALSWTAFAADAAKGKSESKGLHGMVTNVDAIAKSVTVEVKKKDSK